jgi:hypothetical protein
MSPGIRSLTEPATSYEARKITTRNTAHPIVDSLDVFENRERASSNGIASKPSIVEARRVDRSRDWSRRAIGVVTDSAVSPTCNDDGRYLHDIDRKTRSCRGLHPHQIRGLAKIARYCGMVLRGGIELGTHRPSRAPGTCVALSVDSMGRHLVVLLAIVAQA